MARRGLILFAASGTLIPTAALADCAGDINGYWEKRPVGSNGNFTLVESFKIDSNSGILSSCERDSSWDSELRDDGDKLYFTYGHRRRQLSRSDDGTFLTPTWRAEFEGVTSEYRVRVSR